MIRVAPVHGYNKKIPVKGPCFRADTCVALQPCLSLLHSVMNGDSICGSYRQTCTSSSWGRVSLLWGETHGDAFFYSQSSPQDGRVSTDGEVGLCDMPAIVPTWLRVRGGTRSWFAWHLVSVFAQNSANLLASSFLLLLCSMERLSSFSSFWRRREPGIAYRPGIVGPIDNA